MGNTDGFQTQTGQDGFHPDQLKLAQAQLKAQQHNNQLKKEFREKIVAGLFSLNFLVFLVAILVTSSGFVYMCLADEKSTVIEYWKVILPLITTYIGYAIGNASESK